MRDPKPEELEAYRQGLVPVGSAVRRAIIEELACYVDDLTKRLEAAELKLLAAQEVEPSAPTREELARLFQNARGSSLERATSRAEAFLREGDPALLVELKQSADRIEAERQLLDALRSAFQLEEAQAEQRISHEQALLDALRRIP